MRWFCLITVLSLAACARTHAPRPDAAPRDAAPAAASPSRGPAPAPPSFHDFRPSIHGFPFPNGFQGRIFGTGENSYGLCGGMSFAAADFFLSRRPIPGNAAPPADDTPLHRYLYARQAASFGTLGVAGLKFVEWMQLPDDGPDGTHARTLAELPAITRALARGEPIVLGLVLVRADGHAKAWDNHQVLAFAQTTDGKSYPRATDGGVQRPESSTTILRIYDPNFPGHDDITITIRQSEATTVIRQHIPGRGDFTLRGLFRMSYVPVAPALSPQ